MVAIWIHVGFLVIIKMIPPKAIRGSENFEILSSQKPRYATQSELRVVPIFAQSTTPIALCKPNNPAPTNATRRSDTKVELVVTALIRVPAQSAFRIFLV